MENSGELVSGEDLKSNIDKQNESITFWVPVPDSTNNVMDMEGATISEHIPKLCDCLKGECEVEAEGWAIQNKGPTYERGVECPASPCEGGVECSASHSE